jgi:hypothetical protein
MPPRQRVVGLATEVGSLEQVLCLGTVATMPCQKHHEWCFGLDEERRASLPDPLDTSHQSCLCPSCTSITHGPFSPHVQHLLDIAYHGA